jgi:hypothetical protein
MTSLLKVVHSPPLAPPPTPHGRSKNVLTGWITIRSGALGSDHDRRAGRGTGTDEEHYLERRPQPPPPARAGRTGPKRATGLSTGHRGKGQDRDPEHLIAVNRKKPARMGRTPPPITHHGARSL